VLPVDLQHLILIPARFIVNKPHILPTGPGVYLFFLRGGTRLLAATNYCQFSSQRPLSVRSRQYLYTGAALRLAERLRQHMTSDLTSSSLRLSLLAIERVHKGISSSGTPACNVRGEKSLSAWLCANAVVGIELNENPFERERELLATYPSPLNIALRREAPYARALSGWRQSTYPASQPDRARRIRHV
jgi:hypothetical protein